MENKLATSIISNINKSPESLYEYAVLVNDLEFFYEQYSKLFKSNDIKNEFKKIWSDMEILNANALCEWEEIGRPSNEDFSSIWQCKYKSDAKELANKILLIIKSVLA